MRRLRCAVLGGAPALFGSCVVSAAARCPGWHCAAGSAAGTALAAAVVLVGLLAASIVARGGWLAWRGRRSLAILPPAEGGAATVARRRLADRAVLTGGAGIAFCTGLLRPRLYISVDVVDALDDDELAAVVIHESCHAARRDPLRRVARRAVADVLWFIPAAAWWAERRIRQEEMVADVEAERQVGQRPIAGALLKLWAECDAVAFNAAFGDAASARVGRLLGDPPAPDTLPGRLLLMSVVGAAASIPLGICIATLVV